MIGKYSSFGYRGPSRVLKKIKLELKKSKKCPLKCSLICTPLIREVLWLRQFQACPSPRGDLLGDTNVQGRWAGLKLTECLTPLTSFICMSRTEKIIFISWLRTWPRFEKEAWSHSEKGSTSSRCVGE